jgi:hypothetical protein
MANTPASTYSFGAFSAVAAAFDVCFSVFILYTVSHLVSHSLKTFARREEKILTKVVDFFICGAEQWIIVDKNAGIKVNDMFDLRARRAKK